MGRHAVVEDEVREPTTAPLPLQRTGPPSGPTLRRVGLAPGEPLAPPKKPRWRRVVLVVLVLALLGGAGAVALMTIKVPATASAPAPAAPAAPADPLAYLTQTGTFARYFAALDQAGLRAWRGSPRTAASGGVEMCNAFARGSDKAAQLRSWRADPNHMGVPAAQAPAFLDVVTTTICPEYPEVTKRRAFSPQGLPG